MLKDNEKYVFLYIYWKSSGFEPATCLFVLRRGCDLSQSMTYKLLLKELSCMRCNSFGQHLAGKIPKRKIPKQHHIKTSINTPFLSIFCFVRVLWVSMKRWVFFCIKSPEIAMDLHDCHVRRIWRGEATSWWPWALTLNMRTAGCEEKDMAGW